MGAVLDLCMCDALWITGLKSNVPCRIFTVIYSGVSPTICSFGLKSTLSKQDPDSTLLGAEHLTHIYGQRVHSRLQRIAEL